MSSEPSMKQQRDARRAEKVAALKKQQERQKRTRLLTLIGSAVGALAVITLVTIFIITNSAPKADPGDIAVAGVQNFGKLPATHVDGTPVDYQATYGMNPPAGGEHWSAWINCGIYDQPQQNENAVHDLEHGAIWITYDPKALNAQDIATLRSQLPDTYILVSPYPNLPAPVVASAWANQIKLKGVDDPRLKTFITKFWRSPDAPEPTATCTGAIDGPGKVA